MTDKIKEAAAMYKWENHNKYTALQRDALVTGFEAGATSEAAREYWEGQKDEEIARLKEGVKELVKKGTTFLNAYNRDVADSSKYVHVKAIEFEQLLQKHKQ